MLLTITYTGQNTTELGYLLFKNPARPQEIAIAAGKAYVFYPEVSDESTTVALLLDIDPLTLAKGAGFEYVNDRPYVSSSYMSTAIAKAFGTAMTGRGDDHQKLADSALDLTARVTMLGCSGGKDKLQSIFEPLGYEVCFDSFPLDDHFDWGEASYVNLRLRGRVRLCDLLKHLYVLIPVFDAHKHYWVDSTEVDKLLRMGEPWLSNHPEKEYITGRYLKWQRQLIEEAEKKLSDSAASVEEDQPDETRLALRHIRLGMVLAELKASGARTVIDLGCGEGNLLRLLVKESQFTTICGVDVSPHALERCEKRMRLDEASESMLSRINLFQGSLTYKDSRFSGFDAASIVEVIEHIDPDRLGTFERVVFEYARPRTIIITTPNREYNTIYGEFLHRYEDHRFEWTRAEFQEWATTTATRFGYTVRFVGVGDEDAECGTPTQMGVFTCA